MSDLAWNSLVSALGEIYQTKMVPLESHSDFDLVYSPPLTHADITRKPIVVVCGPKGSGKTSFIKHTLRERTESLDLPNIDSGFVAYLGKDREGMTEELCGTVVTGSAACHRGDLPFKGLGSLGSGVVEKFKLLEISSPTLSRITLVLIAIWKKFPKSMPCRSIRPEVLRREMIIWKHFDGFLKRAISFF